jgi:hypothetical protein
MEIRGKAAESLLPFYKVEGIETMVQITSQAYQSYNQLE